MTYQLQAPTVSEREAEVLALLERHMTNAQIAESLFISVRTVESHVSSMLRKLGVPDRRSLARSIPPTEAVIPEPTVCRSQRSAVDSVGLGTRPELTDEVVQSGCRVAEVNACADEANTPLARSASGRRRRHQRRLVRAQRRRSVVPSRAQALTRSDATIASRSA
jgi:DNA-binding CsgD family transcriptional regulator